MAMAMAAAAANPLCLPNISFERALNCARGPGGHRICSGTMGLACFTRRKTRWRRVRSVRCVAAALVATRHQRESVIEAEENLLHALDGIRGRGRAVSEQQLQKISEAVEVLESIEGVKNPTGSNLIEGRWRLIFTTMPGSASPIQRTFVGVDAFSVFQEITLRVSGDPRVCNIVKFWDAFGELRVEAAAMIETGKRILFQFDRAAFSFKFLPFKVPYPVPFRLLGDEAKGWLDTTYLSNSGNIRISRGNKGTTFVLRKEIPPQDRLLLAISEGQGVEEVIEELVAVNPTKKSAELGYLAGKWHLIWSLQSRNANWLQRVTTNFPSWQVIKADSGRLENFIKIFPGIALRAEARSELISNQRRDVNIEGAALEFGMFRIPLNINGSGYIEVVLPQVFG